MIVKCILIRICAGHEIVCYESPRPSMGIHRFVFVLFRQLGRQTVYAPGWRQNFNTRDFAELYNLGSPVAAVYYNCQRESGTGGRRRWTFTYDISTVIIGLYYMCFMIISLQVVYYCNGFIGLKQYLYKNKIKETSLVITHHVLCVVLYVAAIASPH